MPFGIGIWELLIVVWGVAFWGVPAYVIGKKSRVSDPWVAFITTIGAYIVLLRSARISGWWAFLLLLLFIGPLLLIAWIGIYLPKQHSRNQWWTLALIVPVVNIVPYWIYAFTLKPSEAQRQLAAPEQRIEPAPIT